MPVTPICDLNDFDLTKTVVEPDEIRRVCKQRGRMEMLSGIVHIDPDTNIVIGFKDVTSDEWWCEDHIPGRPIFPGALMIEGAAQLATYDFMQRRPELKDAFVGFGGMDKTRFRATVEPDCRMYLIGKVARIRSRMFTYAVQGWVEGEMAFESDILGVVV